MSRMSNPRLGGTLPDQNPGLVFTRNVMTRGMRRCGASAWITVSVLMIALPAGAQTTRKWEFEFHAGGGTVSTLPDGTSSLPAAGSPFTTIVGTTSRRIPSFYFGDGARLLNQVNAALGLALTITPLDPLLQSSLSERERGAIFGFRLSRAITRRYGVEFSVDYGRSPLVLRQSVLDGIEVTRASYVPAFAALISTGPFVGPTVTSVSTYDQKKGSQILATGAITINLLTSGRAIPYVTAGAGYAAHTGATPSASLEGNYRFQTEGRFPMNETDSVALRTVIDEGAVGVFGGGFKFLLSRRWGVRFDLRALINEVSTETLIDTRARQSSATPSGAAASRSTPSLQFSNNSSLGQSSLGGPALGGFRAFEGTGWQTRTNLSAGLYVRF